MGPADRTIACELLLLRAMPNPPAGVEDVFALLEEAGCRPENCASGD